MKRQTITTKRAVIAAVAAAIVVLLLSAPKADAGAFWVRQCDVPESGNLVPYTVNATYGDQGGFSGIARCGETPSGGLGVYSSAGTTNGQSGAWHFAAPAGMDFLGGGAEVSFNDDGGEHTYFLLGNAGGYHSTELESSTNGYTHVGWGADASTTLVSMMVACQASAGCSESANGFAFGHGFVFLLRDLINPATPSLGGDLVSGGWKNGSYGVAVSASDSQGGLELVDLYVNGSRMSRDNLGSQCSTANGWIDRFQPCPQSWTMNRTLATTGAHGFREGANTLVGCAYDYSQDGNRNGICGSEVTVHVDTIAPGPVNELTVADDGNWTSTNSFQPTWQNPPQQHAPIDGAAYRITRSGGGYDSGRQFKAGSGRQSLDELSVPEPGEYRLDVWLRDAAQNESQSSARSLTLRYDPVAPQLSFGSGRDSEDPAAVRVDVADSLSGIAAGGIEFRPNGSNEPWAPIETNLEGTQLVARVPDDVTPGSYEFRAAATDRAGNTAMTERRGDGSQMVEELPLKDPVDLLASIDALKAGEPCARSAKRRGGGKCKKGESDGSSITIGYRGSSQIQGALAAPGGGGLGGRQLTIVERMAPGSGPAQRIHTVTTGDQGGFALELEPGPSRTVSVVFDGDRRYRPVESRPVEVRVRSRVLAFSSPRVVSEEDAIPFRGRIGARGAELGAEGKRIELQYEKSKGNWRTIDAGQTQPNGRFKIRYPLRSNYAQRTEVRFRVLVPPERAWPFNGRTHSRPRTTMILP